MTINCCGMYRSGSTLTYIICQNLINYNNLSFDVVKLHNKIIPSFKSIYTYRDIRDVLVSFIQKDNLTFDSFNIESKNIICFTNFLIKFDATIKRQHENILKLKYETDIYLNVLNTVNKISNFLKIDNIYNIKISNDLSLKNMIETTNNKNFRKNEKTQLWPKHAQDGKIKKYKKFLTGEQLNILYKETPLENWLIKNKYE